MDVDLKVPAPSHADFVTLVNEVAKEEQRLPKTGAIRHVRIDLTPQRAFAGVDEDEPKVSDGEEEGWPNAKNSLKDSDGVGHERGLPFLEENVSEQEPTHHKEHVH